MRRAVHGNGGLDLDWIGVVCRIVDGLDNLLLGCPRHEGGLGAVAVCVVGVFGDDVVVNGVGLGACIGFAALLGEVALGVVSERGFMTHGVNLPDWAVVFRLVVRFPRAENCSSGSGVNLFPLRRVAHPTVVVCICARIVEFVHPFPLSIDIVIVVYVSYVPIGVGPTIPPNIIPTTRPCTPS